MIHMDLLPLVVLDLIQGLPVAGIHSRVATHSAREAIHSLGLEVRDSALVVSILKIYLVLSAMLQLVVKKASDQDLVALVVNLSMLEMTLRFKPPSASWMLPKASRKALMSLTWLSAGPVVARA
jgi:hypothetical protein